MHFRFLSLLVCLLVPAGLKSQWPPTYSLTPGTQGSTGYYFMNVARTGSSASYSMSFTMIIDSTGEMVYFRRFAGDYRPVDFKIQPNGLMSYHVNYKFYLMNKQFKIVDSVSCQNGVATDLHDLQILPNGHYLLLGHEELKADLHDHVLFRNKNYPENSVTTITCGIVQELDATKQLVFEWRSKAHFEYSDMDSLFANDPAALDWTHLNTIEQDQDGNLLLSTRNFSEITKINRKDGTIIWRLGGKKNQFTFTNDAEMFVTQHDVRRLANGHITVFDNGREMGALHPAAAKEYALDEKNLTATLVWKYVNDSAAHSGAGLGNVQRLPNGNTLVSYGRSNRSRKVFSVVTPAGNKCFELEFKDVSRSYRVFNYRTLPFALKRPVIKTIKKDGKLYLDAGKGHRAYYWSTGATTRIIPYKEGSKVFVGVGTPDGGYLVSSPYEQPAAQAERQKD